VSVRRSALALPCLPSLSPALCERRPGNQVRAPSPPPPPSAVCVVLSFSLRPVCCVLSLPACRLPLPSNPSEPVAPKRRGRATASPSPPHSRRNEGQRGIQLQSPPSSPSAPSFCLAMALAVDSLAEGPNRSGRGHQRGNGEKGGIADTAQSSACSGSLSQSLTGWRQQRTAGSGNSGPSPGRTCAPHRRVCPVFVCVCVSPSASRLADDCVSVCVCPRWSFLSERQKRFWLTAL
jgi:hypothetical protein